MYLLDSDILYIKIELSFNFLTAIFRFFITSLKSSDIAYAGVELSMICTSPLYADEAFMFNLKENDVPTFVWVVFFFSNLENS